MIGSNLSHDLQHPIIMLSFRVGILGFLNGPSPASFFVYFDLFKQTLQFLQQINVKKCPSSIRCRDSNPGPSEYESPTITTRPGLLP